MEKRSENHPGVSGKEKGGKTWFNSEKYQEQKAQLESMDEAELGFGQSTGQNLMGRTDLENQGNLSSANLKEKEVFEALKRGPSVDVSNVSVHYDEGTVTLEGRTVSDKESRAIESIVENMPGIEKVVNKLSVTPDS